MGRAISNYQHYVIPAKLDDRFPGCCKTVLLKSLQEIEEVLKDARYIAFDTETSSLSPEEGFIVGYSFSLDGITGYYVPVNHYQYFGNLGKESLAIIHKAMLRATQVFMYNARFDMRFMEWAGFVMKDVKYFDVSVSVFLADTNVPMPSLKWASKHFLGWVQPTFSETLGSELNFSFTDPEESYHYACYDAICTFALVRPVLRFYAESRLTGVINNKFIYKLMKFEEKPLLVDYKYLEGLAIQINERLRELETLIFNKVGYAFKINSGPQLADALLTQGISTGRYTKTGQMCVKIDVLEWYARDHGGKNELIDWVVEHKQMFKLLNSYVSNFAEMARAKDGKLRFAYHNLRAPTLRLACGKDGKNPFFCNMNEQSIPKPHPKMWYIREQRPSDPDDEFNILGYRVSLTEKSPHIIEAQDPKLNIRSAIRVEPGCYWVSIDYSGQELRCIANYSGQKSWIDTFLSGGDLHKQVAIDMVGAENYNKETRKKAKTLNFGIAYGMSPATIKDRYGMTMEEATDFYNQYKRAIPQVTGWMDSLTRKARKEGSTHNYFGAPRRVKFYLQNADPKMRAFGYRTVTNTVVQSTGADITKLAMIKIDDEVLTKRDDIRFLSTIHDEVNFQVPKATAEQDTIKLAELMSMKFKGWAVPFEVGIEVGPYWGLTIPFKMENGKLVPKWEDAEEEHEITEEPVIDTIEEDDDEDLFGEII